MDRLKVRRASRRAQNTRLVNERPSELASFAQLRYDSDLQLHARPLRLPSPVDDPIGGSRLSKRRDPKKTLRNHKSGTRRLCHLKLTVDHLLYEYYLKYTNDASARARITTTVASHVNTASEIFSHTNFEGIVGIKFSVQWLEINDSSHCTGAVGATNPFCADNIDSRGYLSLLALENGDNFCLSYAWSNRDFSGGVLGLAYMSYPPDRAPRQGGVCETRRVMTTSVGPRMLSLNTGILTFLNHGSQVSPAVSEVTFAHELGHSFGASHDAGALCSPNTSDGNYLMYARATVGTLANNRKFSPCSISNMSAVLRSMFSGRGEKRNCFLASQGPFCGNKIREGTEECDCGFMESQCRDSCCFANENKHNAQGCTLRPGTQCSPSAGSCCTGDCRFINTNHQCAPEDECNLRSFCNGVSAQCPEQTKRPDLTVCNQNTQVCIRGHCVGSICLKYGFLDCQLSGGNYSQEDMCRIHCRTNDTGSSCLDPCKIAALKPLCKKVMERGAACNNNLGYCDVYHRCRPVEEEGTLSKLEALLDTGSWFRWVRDNVWLAATFTICIIAAVLLMARYCALFVPSSNPALPGAKSVIQRFRSPSRIPAPRCSISARGTPTNE